MDALRKWLFSASEGHGTIRRVNAPRVESPEGSEEGSVGDFETAAGRGAESPDTPDASTASRWWLALRAWVQTPRGRLLAFGGLAAILVAGIAIVVFGLRVPAPDLVGLDEEGAVEATVDAGLTWSEDNVSWQSTVPRDFQVVGSQSPSPGEVVWRGSEVVISMQPGPVTVPDVVGLSLAAAESAIEGVGLRFDAEFKQDPRSSDWTVVAQDVAAGESLEAWSVIELELEVPDVSVPELIGLTVSGAAAEAERAGLLVQVSPSAAENDWEVLTQSLAAADSVRFGTVIELVAAPPLVTVPSVLGLSQSQARSNLEDLGFVVVFSPTGADSDWSIASQSPAAGSVAREGSTVTVVLREPRIVYSVTGNGSRASITWTIPGSTGSIAQDGNASLPWSISFPYQSGYTSVLAQMLNGSSITCTITVNGVVTKQVTSTGQFAIAVCG